MDKRTIIGGVIILLILGFAVYQGMGIGRRWQTLPLPTPAAAQVTPVPTVDVTANMEMYNNVKQGYSIDKPAGWEVQSITTDKNFDDREVFLPTQSTGRNNISEVSVTVVSKPAVTQDLATDADWNWWLNSANGATESSGLVQKKGEKMVQGNRAVVLWQDQNLPGGYDWSIMAWVRNGKVNYYIDALGSGAFTSSESELFDFMVGSFKYQ